MPSASDFFKELKEANDRLDHIEDRLQALKSSVDKIKTSTDAVQAAVQEVNGSVNAGFGQLVPLVGQLVGQGAFTNEALAHNAKQNDTIICILEHISKNTCVLVNYADQQARLQQGIEASATALAELYADTHAAAAQARAHREEMRRDVERCCPPPKTAPPCQYEPCPPPKPLRPPTTAPRPVP